MPFDTFSIPGYQMHQVYQFLCANPGIVVVPLGNPKSLLFGESQVLKL